MSLPQTTAERGLSAGQDEEKDEGRGREEQPRQYRPHSAAASGARLARAALDAVRWCCSLRDRARALARNIVAAARCLQVFSGWRAWSGQLQDSSPPNTARSTG